MNTHVNATANGSAEPIASQTGMGATPLRFPKPDSKIAKFLGSAAALWSEQRDRLDELEAAYSAERSRKVQDIRKRLHALDDFDHQHSVQMADEKRMLNALAALRDS